MKLTLLAATLALAASAGPAAAEAPEPLRQVDTAKIYSGRWLEVARRPMWITNGCVVATTNYTPRPDGKIDVRDTCRQGGPDGKLREISGVGRIMDPGVNAHLRVRYNLFITWDFVILDHAADDSWFISSDPAFKKLFIFTRQPPTEAELKGLVARAAALGYDVDQLEFPEVLKP